VETSRAYQLLHSIRYAYSDRLITSVELLDRIDELGWFQILENAPSEGGDEDVFVVVSTLLTRVYAARSRSSANPSQPNGSVSKFSYKTGLDSSGGSAGTLFGDCLVLRESQLRGMVQQCVSERVHSLIGRHALVEQRSFDNLTDITDDISRTGSPRGSPTQMQPAATTSSKLLYMSFHSKENIVPLTNAIMAIMFPPVDKKTLAKEASRPNGTIPLLLTSGQIDFYQQQMNKRIQIMGARAYVQQQLQGDTLAHSDEGHSDILMSTRHVDTEEKKRYEKGDDQILSCSGLYKPPPDPPPPVEEPDKFAPPPDNPFTPPSGKVKKEDAATASAKDKTKKVATPMRTPVKPKAAVKPLNLPVPIVVNRNKSFDDSGEAEEATATKNASGKKGSPNQSKATKKEMPAMGGRNMLISRDADGQRVTLRPTCGKDIVDALRVKIFTAGIFPYLLFKDVDQVEMVCLLFHV
jgi:hypothetical protein